jgi:hypothetical protein
MIELKITVIARVVYGGAGDDLNKCEIDLVWYLPQMVLITTTTSERTSRSGVVEFLKRMVLRL